MSVCRAPLAQSRRVGGRLRTMLIDVCVSTVNGKRSNAEQPNNREYDQNDGLAAFAGCD